MALTVEGIAAIVQPFADIYSNSKPLSVGTTIAHVGGLLAGGGLAITTDRAVLRMPLGDAAGQRAVLEDLATTHTLVITSLGTIVVSGLMFLAADVKTFLVSPLYWVKMACVAILLLNGLRLWRAEHRLGHSTRILEASAPMPAREWRALRVGAITSLVFWFVIMALGVALESA
jgi:fumarate reductase subunit D